MAVEVVEAVVYTLVNDEIVEWIDNVDDAMDIGPFECLKIDGTLKRSSETRENGFTWRVETCP